mmetsp:Transcript_53072/g.87943  ORF Transcript_53072/g.87943 Transcript_53072/m.87943 type:complete len:249 (-) Transcript_53072:499-1245(-)
MIDNGCHHMKRVRQQEIDGECHRIRLLLCLFFAAQTTVAYTTKLLPAASRVRIDFRTAFYFLKQRHTPQLQLILALAQTMLLIDHGQFAPRNRLRCKLRFIHAVMFSLAIIAGIELFVEGARSLVVGIEIVERLFLNHILFSTVGHIFHRNRIFKINRFVSLQRTIALRVDKMFQNLRFLSSLLFLALFLQFLLNRRIFIHAIECKTPHRFARQCRVQPTCAFGRERTCVGRQLNIIRHARFRNGDIP